MTDHYSSTPPRELMEQWASEKCYDERDWLYEFHIAARAAQWGADQELEACVEWLIMSPVRTEEYLRAARRPKPPSLKEQALEALSGLEKRWDLQCNLSAIRRALETLND